MRTNSWLFCSIFLVGCNPPPQDTPEEQARIVQVSPSCTLDLASWPIRTKIVSELEQIGTGTLCEGAAARQTADKPLTLDGMTLTIGSSVNTIFAAGRNSGGKIVNTYAGQAIVFDETFDLDVKENQPWASKRGKETRRYWLNSKNGKLVGFRACIAFGEGGYRNQLNQEFSRAFGPPDSIRTLAKISWAPEIRIKWRNGATFRTSNEPNTARLDYGQISDSFAWTDTENNISLYRDLVRREDKLGREEFWIAQMNISQENCFVDDELKKVIQPLLSASISPD